MKQKTKDWIAFVILTIQVIVGIFLIFGGVFRIKCDNYVSTVIIALGVFLLVGSGRKEISEIFSFFKK